MDLQDLETKFAYSGRGEKDLIPDFRIFRIEDYVGSGDFTDIHSRRSYFKVSLVKGESKIYYADLTFTLKGTALVFTNPMCPYHWDQMNRQQQGYVCAFTDSFLVPAYFPNDFPAFRSHRYAVIDLPETKECMFSTLFSKITEEIKSDYYYKKDLVRNMLMQIIHEAQKFQPQAGYRPSGTNASKRISDLFMELLERHFYTESTWDKKKMIAVAKPNELAGHLGIHVNHLNKALKEINGLTTSQIIDRRRLQEAQSLLKRSDWTQSEIAWYLGFAEATHFSRFFKRLSRQSPNEFRKHT